VNQTRDIKMKFIRFFKSYLMVAVLIALFSNVNIFGQIDSKQLAQNVADYLGNYYDQDFQISADQNGIITVSGQVNTLFDKLKIEGLISEVKGVKGINNNIEILNDITADDIIKSNIEYELKMNDAIEEPEKIQVDVKDGVVTLSGTVNYYREKVIAQTIASWQDGANKLISNIVVLPSSVVKSDNNLKLIIKDILRRHFPLEKNVTYTVDKGNVTLNGTVEDLYAKDNIKEDIQRVLGVKSVISNLSLKNDL
jgi:osmotically-inducible protein OsmY